MAIYLEAPPLCLQVIAVPKYYILGKLQQYISTNTKSLNDKYKVIQVEIHISKKDISYLQHADQDGHEHIQEEGELHKSKLF